MKTPSAVILSCLLLSACGGKAAETLPVELVIQHTAGARYLQPAMQACSLKLDPLPIVVKELPADQMNVQAADLTIILVTPADPALPAFQLGTDQLVLVSQTPAPVDTVTLEGLSGVLRGFLSGWGSLGAASSQPAVIIGYLPDNELQDFIEERVINGAAFTSTTTRVEDTTSALALAAAVPGGLALVPRSQLTEAVTVLPIQGLDQQLLAYPILAQTRAEPAGNLKQFMLCLQSEIGRK
jgi:hypothetical protein